MHCGAGFPGAARFHFVPAVVARRVAACLLGPGLRRNGATLGAHTNMNTTLDPHAHVRQQLEAQLDRLLQRDGRLEMNAIRSALTRLDNGTYTECSKCGRSIDSRRLVALPTTTTCLPCSI